MELMSVKYHYDNLEFDLDEPKQVHNVNSVIVPSEVKMVEHIYNDGHEHDWFSPLGAPERCALCGIGKSVHEDKLMEDGLKWREYNLPQLFELLESKQYANDVLTVFQIWEALGVKQA